MFKPIRAALPEFRVQLSKGACCVARTSPKYLSSVAVCSVLCIYLCIYTGQIWAEGHMENLQTAKDIPGLVGTYADESILTPQALATLPPSDMHYLGNGIPKLLHATWKTRKLTEVHSKFLASSQ